IGFRVNHERLFSPRLRVPNKQRPIPQRWRKGRCGNFGRALKDLEDKFNRIDPLTLGVDYIICYAATGCKLRFYGIVENAMSRAA
ncbi:5942_t:CDS:1, partial [Racocetra fulgida]